MRRLDETRGQRGSRIVAAGDLLAAATQNEVTIWNLVGDAAPLVLPATSPNTFLYALGFSRDGRMLAAGGSDGRVAVWDPATGRQLLKLDTHPNVVTSVAFTADGRRLATTCWDGAVRLFDIKTGREALILDAHIGRAYDLCFSPQGDRLATVGADGMLRLWASR